MTMNRANALQIVNDLINQPNYERGRLNTCVLSLQQNCHAASVASGWWHDLHSGEPISTDTKHLVGEKLMLIVSEISEAMEGHRKNQMDDKLPHRKMVEVELADALIRIFDLGGAMELDLAGAVVEKLIFNLSREDHKPENRLKEGGKAY